MREQECELETRLWALSRDAFSDSLHLSASHGRVHDGNKGGVFFVRGSQGRVESCKIWGNAKANVHVQESGSQAVVKGCKCATPFSMIFM